MTYFFRKTRIGPSLPGPADGGRACEGNDTEQLVSTQVNGSQCPNPATGPGFRDAESPLSKWRLTVFWTLNGPSPACRPRRPAVLRPAAYGRVSSKLPTTPGMEIPEPL